MFVSRSQNNYVLSVYAKQVYQVKQKDSKEQKAMICIRMTGLLHGDTRKPFGVVDTIVLHHYYWMASR